MRLLELAAITTEGPSMIIIAPFDPSTVNDIERAIQKSTLGFNPAVNGNTIRIAVPPMSQEQREKYTKLIGQMIEEKRESVRGNREEARRQVKLAVDAKELTEDDKYRLEKEIDEATQKTNEELQKIEHLINDIVYTDVQDFKGSFSAEHGIGYIKKSWFAKYYDPTSYKLAYAIKQLLDPKNILNPGKIFKETDK